MKLVPLAASAVAVVMAMAMFVHFTPSASGAKPPNVFGGPSQTSARVKLNGPVAEKREPREAFSFGGVAYFHRSSQSNQLMDLHEFTPDGQSDLSAWTDMVSLIHYREVKDAEGLKRMAGVMHSMYKSKGKVLIANVSTATDNKPAEYLLVGVLQAEGIVETVFNRLMLHDGLGKNLMVSRRTYGPGAGNEMSDWVREHLKSTSERLVALDADVVTSAIPRP